MYTISNLNELRIPSSYIEFIDTFLRNEVKMPFVQRVVLFGSCVGKPQTLKRFCGFAF